VRLSETALIAPLQHTLFGGLCGYATASRKRLGTFRWLVSVGLCRAALVSRNARRGLPNE
jgi:hypothetical protein